MKIKKKNWGGGQVRCERRSEVFVKIQKKKRFFFFLEGRGSGLVRVDVFGEVKFFVKIQKKIGGGSGRGGGGVE